MTVKSDEEILREAYAAFNALSLTEPRVYNPNCLPRISFMSSEHGTGGHAGTSEGKDPQQMSLFGEEGNDRP